MITEREFSNGNIYIISPRRKKLPVAKIQEIIDEEKILMEDLIKIERINHAYNEIGNININGFRSHHLYQTTLPRDYYWGKINKLTKNN